MTSREIRNRFLSFFERRGHAIIPSASLVPENDPSVLFTTAGMQPLVPYLLGTPHPKGKRLANIQKCVRTQDIEEVGDNTHDTFFEMLGNWSLGDYFKKEAITWSYEFLTSKEEGLGLDPHRLYITVFGGNEEVPEKDLEALSIWKSLGIPEERIYFMEGYANWWSPGDNGPCGPDSEMFYDVTGNLNLKSKDAFIAADDAQQVVEIWNDVFMEYEKKDGKVVGKLTNKNVDTGAGLERVAMVVEEKSNIFDTDIFAPLMAAITALAKKDDLRAQRIVADHLRTAVFMIADGVVPSNTDQGYILRRLLRRAVRYAGTIGVKDPSSAPFVEVIVAIYEDAYPYLTEKKKHIIETIDAEGNKFRKTLERGLHEFEKVSHVRIAAEDAFDLYQSYGFPIEMTKELAEEKGIEVDEKGFYEKLSAHQELSRAGAEQKFKGGLSDTGEKTTMLHTCTHLMLAGLRKFLGEGVHQAGSNITAERTRFDFTHPEKVPREVLDKVEQYVNEAISKGCAVVIEQMPKEEAKAAGVEGSFWEKYPDVVNVYAVKCDDGTVYSRELCGGPHVENTTTIKGTFKIIKEEASSAGVRRVKAVLG